MHHAGVQYAMWAVQGSIFFLSGVALVVWGWAIIGMIVETYGFWCLFAGFIPTALSFLRRIPVFGRILDLPVFKKVQPELLASIPLTPAHADMGVTGEPALAVAARPIQWCNQLPKLRTTTTCCGAHIHDLDSSNSVIILMLFEDGKLWMLVRRYSIQ